MVSRTSETPFDPNGLLVQVQGAPVFGEMVTIASGANLVAGDLLGQITSGGKYIKSLSGAGDGSETPCAIIAEACDASGGDKSAFVYYAGEFNEAKVNIGASHTAAALRRTLAQKGIFLVKPVAA